MTQEGFTRIFGQKTFGMISCSPVAQPWHTEAIGDVHAYGVQVKVALHCAQTGSQE